MFFSTPTCLLPAPRLHIHMCSVGGHMQAECYTRDVEENAAGMRLSSAKAQRGSNTSPPPPLDSAHGSEEEDDDVQPRSGPNRALKAFKRRELSLRRAKLA
ncbi:unnamed protein product [Prorocentrum cordatum]|uniref:Uncharacterized protein n=1 Tax=Prorocentrum cordatum TaxID=2364126 RepID=A0ABN9USC0_9DINO|nr:unnamed protein product [Polarella glacialis]